MKSNCLLLSLLIVFSNCFGQSEITVAEGTLKIGGLTEENLYYGFAEGDQIVFSFEETKGKGLKEFEIIEYPSTSRFKDYESKIISDKTIIANNEGVFQFRFENTALTGRICKYKIVRIPGEEQFNNFNTSISWETIFDTSYTTTTERYLVKKEYIPKVIVPSTEYFINSGSNAFFEGGSSRITFPVNIPENAIEWYYVFSASREKSDIDNIKESFDLAGQLTSLIDQTGALEFGINLLIQPPGGNVCDIYLLDYENSRLFDAKEPYSYYVDGSRENIMSGIIKIPSGRSEKYYVGIKNPDDMYGIHVVIEVVAVLYSEEWEERTIQIPNVSSYQIPIITK